MKRLILFLIIISICFCLAPESQAQVGMKKLGQSTMNFLKVGVSARAASMGNAYTAIGNDVESVFYNPAGLAGVSSGFSAFVSHTQWIADINYTAGAVAKSFGNFGTFAISVLAVDYGDIQGVQLISESDPKGYLETGNVDVGAYAFGLAYARQISSQFSMGGMVQYVSQRLGETELADGVVTNEISKLTFNFGVKYLTNFKKFRFAMAIRNFSTAAKYEEVSAQLPLLFVVGAGMDLLDVFTPNHSGDPLLVSVEFLHPNNYTERVNVGCEYTLLGMLALRAGYEFNRDLAGLSAGIGFSPKILDGRLGSNYSYSAFDMFDMVNRFSLNVKF